MDRAVAGPAEVPGGQASGAARRPGQRVAWRQLRGWLAAALLLGEQEPGAGAAPRPPSPRPARRRNRVRCCCRCCGGGAWALSHWYCGIRVQPPGLSTPRQFCRGQRPNDQELLLLLLVEIDEAAAGAGPEWRAVYIIKSSARRRPLPPPALPRPAGRGAMAAALPSLACRLLPQPPSFRLCLLMGWVKMGFKGWVLKWSVFG
ncbi:hypothetical protein PVAP13_1KG192000 [Panicum virgatum]|uniref:Uncharacterized protein n=1 Tax=Panicum virgatum TaxID=38727 RepID=A0A8T0XII9_PANVG|nr:hypothetical protein PVAP13_1KG192000 [Panicum virgatum]